MDKDPNTIPLIQRTAKPVAVKICGIGNAGLKVVEHLIAGGMPASLCAAINADRQSLEASSAGEKLQLETQLLRGLGSGGDPDRGRAVAEEHAEKLKTLCASVDVVFLIAGLGGGAGTGITPVLARVSKEQHALVLAFITTPFECEGNRRLDVAENGFEELQEVVDGIICLPNQKLFKLIDEDTSVLETFKISTELLAEVIHGVWRLLTHKGLIEIHFETLCEVLRDRHAESAFATAEAIGPARSGEVLDKLLAHPLLDSGEVLRQSEIVLLSLVGGPDLTMAEVNRVTEGIKGQSKNAQLIIGAVIDEAFHERLAVTLIATRECTATLVNVKRVHDEPEELANQLLERGTVRPASRLVPPAPVLPADQMQQMLSRQTKGSRVRKLASKMRQGQLPLEIISKGRFDRSEPTIHKGEDLDVPTYIRRGISLN